MADLVAHTCGTMLLDALGKIHKIVNVPNSGYDDDVEIDLGFEMWAGIRYAFLSVGNGADIDDEDFSVVLVEPHGLYIDPSASPEVAVGLPMSCVPPAVTAAVYCDRLSLLPSVMIWMQAYDKSL